MVFRALLIQAAQLVLIFFAASCNSAAGGTSSKILNRPERQNGSLIPGPREEKSLRESVLGKELSDTIRGFNGVENARVHVILADHSLFSQDMTSNSSAAVLVSGFLRERIDFFEIKKFLCAAVPDLQADAVNISFSKIGDAPIDSVWVGPVEVAESSEHVARIVWGVLLVLCFLLALGLVYAGFKIRAFKKKAA